MPIFRFVAVAGCLLLALLFVADATLKPRGPLFTNNSEGLTRSEPARTQTAQRAPEAQRPQETPRPRAPALVPNTALQPAPAAKPVAPPIAEIAQAVETPPAATQPATEIVNAELPKSQPAKTEPAKIEVAKTEVPKAEITKAEAAKAEAAKTEAAKTEVAKTESIKIEPAKAEPPKTKTAKLEAGAAEPARSNVIKREAVTAATKETSREAANPAPAPKMHKQVTRKPERGNHYAAYRDSQTSRDDVPTVDNGYAYGVAPSRARAERQQPWGGEFGQGRYRF